jgi:hypothetical protein
MSLHGIPSAALALAAAVVFGPLGCAATGATAGSPGMRTAPISAPQKPWDQAAVAKLASDLAKSCSHLYDEFYAEQGIDSQIGSGDEADGFRLKSKLQRIEEQAFSLAGALAAGKSRAETTPSVEDIGELSRDARDLLSRMFVEIPLTKRIDAARAIWLQILPYYGIAPPADTPTQQP